MRELSGAQPLSLLSFLQGQGENRISQSCRQFVHCGGCCCRVTDVFTLVLKIPSGSSGWKPHAALWVLTVLKAVERSAGEHVYFDVPDKSKESFHQHFFKHGGTAELKCFQKSNLARVVWKFQNGELKAMSPKYGFVGGKHLLIFNLSDGDSGVYQCLSEERVRNKTVSQLLAKHILEVKMVPRIPPSPTSQAAQTEGSRITSKMASTQGSSPPTPALWATSPRAATLPPKSSATSTPCEPKMVINTVPQLHSEKTVYLKSSDNRLLMSLLLFIFVLFLCLFSYNCYKGYLPGQCLKFRSALLLGKKKPKSDFSDLEQSVKETLVEPGSFSQQNGDQPKPALDTGYETEQDTITSKVPTDREDSQRIDELSARDKPFDVKCELKFADSDADGD